MKKVSLCLLSTLALACQLAVAQTADPLKEAAQRAIATNPEVTAKFNAYKAALDDLDIARSAYYPRVDLTADAGRTRDRFSNRAPADQTMGTTGVALSATQLLWDGLGTKNQVDRFTHARLTRYFEFLDTSEQTALEAVRAYVDVARTRELVKLAEDNYVQHRQVVDQIQSRVKAGVGRGVDLEQAAARLALAESNLVIETSNLHDVTERYRRIVGAAPGASLALPSGLTVGLPANATSALDTAARRNAAVAAAVENLRAAQAQSKERDGLYHPRVEAQIRTGAGHNFDGQQFQKRDTTASLMLKWNLFNGGADQARVRQAASLLSQATDLRDKACRDARQTSAIAFNDTYKLTEQIGYLDRNVLSNEKARDAYRQQFDIGQRSLLDVLNAESELFTARRALTNANHDLIVAQARTHAAASNLVSVLGLSRVGANEQPAEAGSWAPGGDVATRCPLEPTGVMSTPKSELDARARAAIATTPTPAAVTTASAAASATPPAPAPVAAPTTSVSQRLVDWTTAWTQKDVTRYLSFYAPNFQPPKGTRAKWLNDRAKQLRTSGSTELKIANVQRRSPTADTVETSFDQTIGGKSTSATSRKTLVWQRSGSDWYIIRETTP